MRPNQKGNDDRMINLRSTPRYDRYRAITRANIERTEFWSMLTPEMQEAIEVVSCVLPFRSNDYVVNELIDWDNLPDDPIFQLTFPQRAMLHDDEYETIARLLQDDADKERLSETVNRIRMQLNPHPAGQMTDNVPMIDGLPLPGAQHKYRQTLLFFPSQGQTCHAYCTFCFRWAQFVGMDELKFSASEVEMLIRYLREHEEITDVLFTGGDPMIMKAKVLARYIEPILEAGLDHIQTIRIGTKAVGYWPQRFVTDDDADDVLRLFESIRSSGKNLALMGHYSHPVELETDIAQQAVRRIRSTGAVVRMQSPCIKHVNDDADAWARLWNTGMKLGCVPYYMFVERNTGARDYFSLPLARVWQIFRLAYQQVSGLGRTVRGPSMSAHPGKVHVIGVTDVGGKKAFVLEYLQARDPEMVRLPFFAKYNGQARWFDDLEPLTERDRPFFLMPEHVAGNASGNGNGHGDVSLSILDREDSLLD